MTKHGVKLELLDMESTRVVIVNRLSMITQS